MENINAKEVIETSVITIPVFKNYRRLYRDDAHRLSEISPAAVIREIIMQWSVIVAVFSLCAVAAPRLIAQIMIQYHPMVLAALLVLLFLASGFIMACKQHALGVIMHDATHYRLLSTKRWNDTVSDLFCAFPIGMVTASYRRGHLPHHVFTNKPLDPYWARLSHDAAYLFPMGRNKLLRMLLRDVTGLNIVRWWPVLRAWTGWAFIFRDPERYLSPSNRRRFTVFWAAVALASYLSGLWLFVLLLWVLPMMTLNLAFTRLRIIAEHDLEVSENEIARTRHVDGTWLERFAIGPLNINYHIAHHLFPIVPLYNLPEMHRVLMADPEFSRDAQLWKSYLGRNGIISSLIQ